MTTNKFPSASTNASPASKAVIYVPVSSNSKTGHVAATYTSQETCNPKCPFMGSGCYAEAGRTGVHTARLNANAHGFSSLEIVRAEAHAIMTGAVVRGLPLRMHVVGDVRTNQEARILADAAADYRRRGGGPVWTYTHSWRTVRRESFGGINVLASCETTADVELARSRGYNTALVVDTHEAGRETLAAAGQKGVACPEQTHGIPCSDCNLCMMNLRGTIMFAAHGSRNKALVSLGRRKGASVVPA